jgi:hypothetical protein
MRLAFLPLLLLAACGDDGMTSNFSMSRDSAPETMSSMQMPLSAPPSLTMRPVRATALSASSRGSGQPADAGVVSAGQDALLQASGPPAEADIRTVISENSGMVYPGPGFVDRMMNWTPPPGYTPVITQARGGGSWLGRIF